MLTLESLATGTTESTEYCATKSEPVTVAITSLIADNHPTPLKIIIVGTGPGGLSAALSLRRNGHHVEVTHPPISMRR